LRYLVGKELEGCGTQLKAFSIAVDVLGRDASFDPNTDSIVRSEIGRLRDALRLYFAEMADSDNVTIEIPKGTYRPAISTRTAQSKPRVPLRYKPAVLIGLCVVILGLAIGAVYRNAPPDTSEALTTRLPASNLPYDLVRIAVAPFTGSGSNPESDLLAFGVYSELSMGLAAYPWIAVVSPVNGIDTLDSTEVDYVLIGDVHWNEDTILTSARLVDIDDERVVWSDTQTLTAEPKPIKASVTHVTSQIASELGSMQGIAPELLRDRNAEGSPENLQAFICFLQSYAYLAEPTDSRHLALRDCLSEAVERFPTFGDGWAALARVYIDEARFGRNKRVGTDPWQAAKEAMDQALKYAPLRMPTLNVALILSIEAPEQDRVAFERYSSLLLHLYPRHPYTLNNVGSRMAEFTGQWEEGLELISEAIDLEPDPPSSFYVTNAYRAAVWGSAEEALSSVQPLTTSTSESQLILRYLAAARNGLDSEMRVERELLAQQGLVKDDDIIMHVMHRRYVNELETALIEQLQSAFKLQAAE
jgi:TolB-like protein